MGKGDRTLALLLTAKDQATAQLKAYEGQLKALNRTVTSLANDSKTTAAATRGMETALGSLSIRGAAAAVGLGAVVDMVSQFGSQMSQIAERAGTVTKVTNAFDVLSRRVGETSEAMLGGLRRATGGVVEDMELMRLANNAIILGLPVTASSMERLAGTAVRLGQAMGIDAKSAIESVVVGIGRQSRLWLDNIGIVVDAESAYRSYAAELGKTVAQLTDAEKKAAFYNATVKAADVASNGLASSTGALSTAWQILKADVRNATDEFLAFLNAAREAEAFAQKGNAISVIASGFEKLRRIDADGKAVGLINDLSAAFRRLDDARANAGRPFGEALVAEAKSDLDKVKVQIGAVMAEIKRQITSLSGDESVDSETLNRLRETFEGFARELAGTGVKIQSAVPPAVSALERLNASLVKLGKEGPTEFTEKTALLRTALADLDVAYGSGQISIEFYRAKQAELRKDLEGLIPAVKALAAEVQLLPLQKPFEASPFKGLKGPIPKMKMFLAPEIVGKPFLEEQDALGKAMQELAPRANTVDEALSRVHATFGKLVEAGVPLNETLIAQAETLIVGAQQAEAFAARFDAIYQVTSALASAYGSAIDAMVGKSATFGQAIRKMASDVLRSIGSQALVKAAWELAEALAAMGTIGPSLAQWHFRSAAQYALVGTMATAAAGAMGYARGGVVGGMSGTDSNLARLTRGETVLDTTPSEARRLMSGRLQLVAANAEAQGGGTVVVNGDVVDPEKWFRKNARAMGRGNRYAIDRGIG